MCWKSWKWKVLHPWSWPCSVHGYWMFNKSTVIVISNPWPLPCGSQGGLHADPVTSTLMPVVCSTFALFQDNSAQKGVRDESTQTLNSIFFSPLLPATVTDQDKRIFTNVMFLISTNGNALAVSVKYSYTNSFSNSFMTWFCLMTKRYNFIFSFLLLMSKIEFLCSHRFFS